jgi:hypothetical protein
MVLIEREDMMNSKPGKKGRKNLGSQAKTRLEKSKLKICFGHIDIEEGKSTCT